MAFKTRQAKGIKMGTFLALFIILVLSVMVGIYGYNYVVQQNIIKSPVQPPTNSNLIGVNKPIEIAVNDPLQGVALSGASIKVLEGTVVMETLTTSGAGIATTALPYQSGTSLILEVSASGYVTEYVPVVVPQMTPQDAQAQADNYLHVTDIQVGVPSIQINYAGTNYAASTLNFTTLGISSATLTVTIYNTKVNSGWVNSYDPINAQNLNIEAELSTTGSSVSVTGLSSISRGTSTYYLQQVNSGFNGNSVQVGGFSTSSSGGQTIGGVFTYSFTVSKASLAHGSTQSFTLQLYQGADGSLFISSGTFGPDATSLGSSTTITFAA